MGRLKRTTLALRVDRSGMPIERAVALGANGWAKPIEHNGETLTSCQWAKRLGISASTINYRLKSGWSVAEALTANPDDGRARMAKTRSERCAKRYELDGEQLTIAQLAQRSGRSAATIRDRLKRGLSTTEATKV